MMLVTSVYKGVDCLLHTDIKVSAYSFYKKMEYALVFSEKSVRI